MKGLDASMHSKYPIEALTFDVGYTLFDDKRLVSAALPAVYDWLRKQGFQGKIDQFLDRYYYFDRLLDNPAFSHTYGEPAIWGPILKDLGLEHISADDLLKEYRTHLLNQLGPSVRELEALQWAKQQGLKLGLITNERAIRINTFINHAGFRPLLDSIVISEERRVGKPSPQFFQMALDELQVPAQSVIHFGDNEITDGACKNLGMRFVLVTGYKDPDHTWGEGNAETPDHIIEYITRESLEQCLRVITR